ncbi:MAG: DeoR/GlpR transcriptional regulator [Selenomonas sp.]|nr:DeoR/GlpR transcriptional regulator [Selenomonas sp.]
MLTEERYAIILRILEEKKAVTVLDLTKALDASESTVRRDLTALHKSGRLYKVYGGATSIDNNYSNAEEDMKTKNDLFPEEKIAIAKKAASLIKRKDFVYIDAGTTTLHLIDFITETSAVFVTNGISMKSGFSTPDAEEGTIKGAALSRCKNAYVLADQSKFNKISPITFAHISSATIITGKLTDIKYRDYTTILEGE